MSGQIVHIDEGVALNLDLAAALKVRSVHKASIAHSYRSGSDTGAGKEGGALTNNGARLLAKGADRS